MPFVMKTLRELGGLNENEDPNSLRETDLTEANNVARLGVLTGTRPGMGFDTGGEYESAISGTPAVQGIREWSYDRDTNREVVVVAGGDVWNGPADPADKLDKTTNTVTITSGANNLWSFADHNHKLFAAGGASGDSFWYWDGTNPLDKIDVQNSAAQTLQPKYVFEWKNYLFLTGLQGRTLADDNPLLWRYHDLGSDPTDATNWPTSNTIGGSGIGGVAAFGSEFSTGTAAFQDNNGAYLLLLSNKRIYSYVQNEFSLVGFQKNDEIANGCVSQHAYVDLGLDSGDAIYMSEVGIHSLRLSQQYSGRARAFLSWPIRKTFAALNRNRFPFVTAGYWPTEGLVAFAVSTGSSSTHDLILAMDIQEAQEITPDTVRWYRWTLAPGLSESINFLTFGRDASNLPVMFVGTTAGKVGRLSRASYLDFSEEYETALTTKHDDHEAPGVQKTVGDVHIVARGNGDYEPTHQYVFDYGARMGGQLNNLSFPSAGAVFDTSIFDTDVFAGAQLITREKFYGVGAGETVAHRFKHTPSPGTSEPFFISRIAQQLANTGESDASEEAA